MNLDSFVDIAKLLFSGGLTALVLSWFYHQMKIAEERERLLEQKKINEIREQEDAITKKINSMSRADLIKSSEDIASRIGKQ